MKIFQNFLRTQHFIRSTCRSLSLEAGRRPSAKEINERPLFGSAAKKILFDLPKKTEKIKSGDGLHTGKPGQLSLMRRCVSALVTKERIELPYPVARHARAYTERLIQLSIIAAFQDPRAHKEIIETIESVINSTDDQKVIETERNTAILETCMFWLQKDFNLILRLFQVLVPRYQHYNRPYTDLFKLTYPYISHQALHQYSMHSEFGVLELHGNPWPKIGSPGLRFDKNGNVTKHPFKEEYLINILLNTAKEKYSE